MTKTLIPKDIIEKIEHEIEYSENKHGTGRSHSIYKWLSILTEEVGEAHQAALNWDEAVAQNEDECWEKFRDEVAQVAAVCIKILNSRRAAGGTHLVERNNLCDWRKHEEALDVLFVPDTTSNVNSFDFEPERR